MDEDSVSEYQRSRAITERQIAAAETDAAVAALHIELAEAFERLAKQDEGLSVRDIS